MAKYNVGELVQSFLNGDGTLYLGRIIGFNRVTYSTYWCCSFMYEVEFEESMEYLCECILEPTATRKLLDKFGT